MNRPDWRHWTALVLIAVALTGFVAWFTHTDNTARSACITAGGQPIRTDHVVCLRNGVVIHP